MAGGFGGGDVDIGHSMKKGLMVVPQGLLEGFFFGVRGDT